MRYLLSILGMLLLGCIPGSNLDGKDIINKSILAHGSWDAFMQLDTISFLKSTQFYDEFGEFETENSEWQQFILKPKPSITIVRRTDSAVFNGESLMMFIGDSVLWDKEKRQQEVKRLKGAEFVFFQPFKLNDSVAEISYTGSKTIMDSVVVSEVQINYPNSPDTWWFYFDEKYRLVANKVFHNNRYSLIENLEFQQYKGLLFNKHRKSYFVDSLNQKMYLRAEYFYQL